MSTTACQKFAKLFGPKGEVLASPQPVAGSVSFDARTGEAHAWAEDGRTCLGQMVKARVSWIGAAGLRLEGMEPHEGSSGVTFRAMEWQLIF